jgi:hypothetical protein
MTTGGGLSRWGAVLLLACNGCSLLYERLPPSASDSSTSNAPSSSTSREQGPREKPCPRDGFWSPLFDTTWALGGLGWVLYADDKAKGTDSVPAHQDGFAYYPEQPGTPGDNGSAVQAARIWGYGSMAFFAASAIYGYVVEGSCASYRNRREQEAKGADNAEPARHGFPGSVLQFRFGMTQAEAGNACESSGRVFHVDGAGARCVNAPGSTSAPEIRIRYTLGTPSEITVIYRASRQGLNEQYRVLNASLRGFYGDPQVARPNLSAACAPSLERCLAAGEHPDGPVWHWPIGNIEIAPVWRDDQALIELRYTREE